jgi:glycosyltransferase involved in cell wall biosynthesis
MPQPLFSIIAPSYNSGAKLARTIDSVLSQDAAVEMVVVDGGSTDGTADLLKGYGDRVVWVSEKDSGLYDAMNKGIAMAKGRYLNFQGAGDVIRPGVLDQLASRMPDQPLSFVYGRVYLVDAGHEHGEPFTRMTLRNGNIPHQGIFYERTIFDLVGLYQLEYRTGADYVMAMRCYREDRIVKTYVDIVVADFEGGGVSQTNPDQLIDRDLPKLIRANLGVAPYLVWRAQRLVPPWLREARIRLRRRVRTQ